MEQIEGETMKSLFLQFSKFCLLSTLILDVNSVYANTPSQNQCAKLLVTQKPSFAEIVRGKIQSLQERQARAANEQEAIEKQRKEEESRQRDAVHEEADPIKQARKIHFIEIAPRKFQMGKGRDIVDVEITRPYGIMDTKMTQMMYTQLMRLFGIQDLKLIFPSHFNSGFNYIEYIYKGKSIPKCQCS